MDCDEKQNLIIALLALCGFLLVIVLAIIAFVLRVKNCRDLFVTYICEKTFPGSDQALVEVTKERRCNLRHKC